MIKKLPILLISCLAVFFSLALIPNKAAEAASVSISSIYSNPAGVGEEVLITVTATGNQLTGISLYIDGKMDKLYICREGGTPTGTPVKSCAYEFKKTFSSAGQYLLKGLAYSLNENFASTPEKTLDVIAAPTPTPALSGTATISPTTVRVGENFTITVVGSSQTAVSMVVNIYPSGAGATPIASKSCSNAITCQVSKVQNKSQPGSVSYYGYITAEGGSYKTGLATIDISSAATVPSSPSSPTSGTGQSSGSACPAGQICNPLAYDNLEDLINTIIWFLIKVGTPIAAIMFVIAGILFVTSAGDSGRIKTARGIMIYTAVGLGVIILASGLIKVIQSLLGGS